MLNEVLNTQVLLICQRLYLFLSFGKGHICFFRLTKVTSVFFVSTYTKRVYRSLTFKIDGFSTSFIQGTQQRSP